MGRKPRDGDSPLSKLRVKAGMTQKQLAEKVGCSVSLIQKLEIGSRRLWNFKFLEKLFIVFELKADIDQYEFFMNMDSYWEGQNNGK
nr:MAG TPA: Helix-turn-helix XRE-family like protein [Bacteriophage sp.]